MIRLLLVLLATAYSLQPTACFAQGGQATALRIDPATRVHRAALYSGATPAAQIAACLAGVQAQGGGTCDASGLMTPFAAATTIALAGRARLILPVGAITSSASPAINITGDGAEISCAMELRPHIFTASSTCSLATTHTTGDIIQVNAANVRLHDFDLFYAGAAARTAGAGIKITEGSNATVERVGFYKTWIGLNMAEGGSSGTFNNIVFGDTGAGAGGAWHAMIALGGCTGVGTPAALSCAAAQTWVVTDTQFNNVIMSVASIQASGAALLIDGGTDTIRFTNLEVIKTGVCESTTDCGVSVRLQNTVGTNPTGFDPPRWITFTNLAVENFHAITGANPAVYIGAGKGVTIRGGEISDGIPALLIKGGDRVQEFVEDVEITGVTIPQAVLYGIILGKGTIGGPSGPNTSGINIHDNFISCTSQGLHGGVNAIEIEPNMTRFKIDRNRFDRLFSVAAGCSALPGFYVGIGAGSDEFSISGNSFQSENRLYGDINDASGGLNKTVGPNQTTGTAAANRHQLYGGFQSLAGYGPAALPNFLTVDLAGGGPGTPGAVSMAFGDGTGYSLDIGYPGGGAFHPKIRLYDDGRIAMNNAAGAWATLASAATADYTYTFPDAPGTLALLSDIGAPAWGSITGSLSDQTDLQNALNAKVTGTSLATAGRLGRVTGAGALADSTGIFEDGSGNIGVGNVAPASRIHATQDADGARTGLTVENLDQRLKMMAYYEVGVDQYSVIQASNDAGAGTNLHINPDGGNVTLGGTTTMSTPASSITSGTVALARGGTAADLSATGGATKFLAQDAAHVISARDLIAADVPNLAESQITNLVTDLAGKAAATHAAQHKNGGGDEVATATPTTNAIPKTGSGTALAAGWIPDLSSQYSVTGHYHAGADITSGTVSAARLPATVKISGNDYLMQASASGLVSGTKTVTTALTNVFWVFYSLQAAAAPAEYLSHVALTGSGATFTVNSSNGASNSGFSWLAIGN